MTDEMKALIDSVAHDIVEHRWPHVDAEVFEELRQAHLDLAEKIVTEVLAALSAHSSERFAFTDAEWREYQAMPEQGYSHRGKLEFFVNRWLSAHPAEAIEAAREASGTKGREATHDHKPVQHRDGREPWCKVCGLNRNHEEPHSRLGRAVPGGDS